MECVSAAIGGLTALRKSLTERIEAAIAVTDAGCWEWTTSFSEDGYGRIGVDGKQRRAHRVVYEHLVGPIPDGLDRAAGCCPTQAIPTTTTRGAARVTCASTAR